MDMKAEIGVLEAKLVELNKQRDVSQLEMAGNQRKFQVEKFSLLVTQARLQLLAVRPTAFGPNH